MNIRNIMFNCLKPNKNKVALAVLVTIAIVVYRYLNPSLVLCIPSLEGPTGLEKYSLSGRSDGCRVTLDSLVFEYIFNFPFYFLISYLIISMIYLGISVVKKNRF